MIVAVAPDESHSLYRRCVSWVQMDMTKRSSDDTVALRPSRDELRARIQREVDFFGGVLPERNAIAWGAYIAALCEWNLISGSYANELLSMLPFVKNNPVYGIETGNPGGDEASHEV